MGDETRKKLPLFAIGIVTKLTQLTPRQIRYYEQQELIFPIRTDGNQRLFSFIDVDRLLQIKEWIEKGVNIAGIKQMLKNSNGIVEPEKVVEKVKKELSEEELRKILRRQLTHPSHPSKVHLTYGELTRFFNQS